MTDMSLDARVKHLHLMTSFLTNQLVAIVMGSKWLTQEPPRRFAIIFPCLALLLQSGLYRVFGFGFGFCR